MLIERVSPMRKFREDSTLQVGQLIHICTCQYLVVRDRIVLNKAKVNYHDFYHFGFVVFFSSWELWSTNINTIQYLQSAMYQVISIPPGF